MKEMQTQYASSETICSPAVNDGLAGISLKEHTYGGTLNMVRSGNI